MIEIYIAGQLVSAKDEYFELKKSINVLLEPDKRASEVTRTVEVLGSKEADRVFMAQFDVNFNAGNIGFDPTRKAPLVVYENSIEIMRGYAQLTDVVILNEVNHMYKCVFYGVLKDLFATLGDDELCDIDWSDLNHAYTAANIEATWTATTGEGYVYPMVNYGWNSNFIIDVLDFRTWVYFKEIWDRIFSEAGFVYQSDFINSALFKKLIYYGDEPFQISQAAIAASNTEVSRITSNQSIPNNFTLIQWNNVVSDPSSQWTGAPDYKITPASQGVHEITVNLIGQVRNDGADLAGGTFQARILFQIRVKDSGGNILVTQLGAAWSGTATSMASGSSFSMALTLTFSHDFATGDYVEIEVLNGQIFEITNNATIFRRITSSNATVFVDAGSSFSLRLASNKIGRGNTIDVGLMSVGCMKQKDWLMGVIKMFNLYIDTLPNGDLIIEPRDTFYTNQVVDLTTKLAVDRDFIIKPLELAKYKRYKYYYEAGTDWFAESHYDTYNSEPYGSIEIEINNDFAKETKEVNLPFSLPCMSINTVTGQAFSPRVVPVLINKDNNETYKGSGIGKVLVWGGLEDTEAWLWNNTPRTTYPYAGQLDDLENPTFDLAFDIPPEIYWKLEGRNDVALVENGGLYPQYHETEIEELTNKNSKIVQCSLALNESDFNQLSFRKLYFLRNAFYRLHEVIYTGAERLSEVVLLKLNKYDKRVASDIIDRIDSNIGDRSVSVVIGRENNIEQANDGIIVIGTNNQLTGSLSGVIVSGSDNTVTSDNVTIFNLNNQTNPLQNTLSLGYNGATYTETTTYEGVEGSPFIAMFNAGTSVDYQLTEGVTSYGKYVTVKSINGQNVVVKQGASEIATITDRGDFYHNGTTWIKI